MFIEYLAAADSAYCFIENIIAEHQIRCEFHIYLRRSFQEQTEQKQHSSEGEA